MIYNGRNWGIFASKIVPYELASKIELIHQVSSIFYHVKYTDITFLLWMAIYPFVFLNSLILLVIHDRNFKKSDYNLLLSIGLLAHLQNL